MRRLPLLSLLVSLCLLGLTGAADAGSTAASTGRGDAILSVQSHVGVAARTVADRLTGPSTGRLRHAAPAAALPAAALGALLLAATVVRRRRLGTAPQAGLLAAAGRGPPHTS